MQLKITYNGETVDCQNGNLAELDIDRDELVTAVLFHDCGKGRS